MKKEKSLIIKKDQQSPYSQESSKSIKSGKSNDSPEISR